MLVVRFMILLVLCAVWFPCHAQKTQAKEPVNKKGLNIEALIREIKYFSAGSDKEFVHVVKGGLTLRFRNLPRERDVIYLVEKDTRTGDSSVLHGSKQFGYEKSIYRHASDLVEKRAYYPNGALKSVGYIYNKCCSTIIVSYPVGKTFLYDETGKLSQVTDHDKTFKFGLKHVKKLVMDRKPDLKSIQIFGLQYSDTTGRWSVEYKTEKDGNCSLDINSSTGTILQDRKNLVVVY